MTYVFQCRSCGHQFEMTATVAEYEARPAPSCPRCDRRQARRVYTPIMVMTTAGRAGNDAPGGGCCGGGTCGCRH